MKKTPFENFKNKAVFIMGHRKSGTTLLASLLDNHPQLVVFPLELSYANVLYKNAKGLLSNKKKLAILLQGNRLDNPDYQIYDGSYGLDREIFIKKLYEKGNKAIEGNDKELFLAMIEGFYDIEKSSKQNKKAWVEKTTSNYLNFPAYKKWFNNDMVCLHIVRNPYDNFVSYRKFVETKLCKEGPKVDDFCFDWAFSNQIARIAQKKVANYHIIKYEDLVHNPNTIMQNVASWINIDYTPSLLEPTLNGQQWVGNSMHNTKFKNISLESVGRYKNLLKEEEIKRIKSLLYEFNLLFRIKLHWKIFLFRLRWTFPSLHGFLSRNLKKVKKIFRI